MRSTVTFEGNLEEMAQLFGQLSTLKLEGISATTAGDTASTPRTIEGEAKPAIEAPKRGPGRPAKQDSRSSAKFKEATEAVPVEPELPIEQEKPAAAPAPAAPKRSVEEHAAALRDKMTTMIKDMGPNTVVSILKKFGVGKLANLASDKYVEYEAELDAAYGKWKQEKSAADAIL